MCSEPDLEIRETSLKIITAFEKKSGYPVQMVEDANLPVLVTVRLARENTPVHVVLYKLDTKNKIPYFAICWHCALTLRMFECPPKQRYVIAGNQAGSQALDNILNVSNGIVRKYHLDKNHYEAFRNAYSGWDHHPSAFCFHWASG